MLERELLNPARAPSKARISATMSSTMPASQVKPMPRFSWKRGLVHLRGSTGLKPATLVSARARLCPEGAVSSPNFVTRKTRVVARRRPTCPPHAALRTSKVTLIYAGQRVRLTINAAQDSVDICLDGLDRFCFCSELADNTCGEEFMRSGILICAGYTEPFYTAYVCMRDLDPNDLQSCGEAVDACLAPLL